MIRLKAASGKNNAGFTLIEVLVALTVLACVGFGVSWFLVRQTRVMSVVLLRRQAGMVAHSVISAIRLGVLSMGPAPSSLQGNWLWGKIMWRYDVKRQPEHALADTLSLRVCSEAEPVVCLTRTGWWWHAAQQG